MSNGDRSTSVTFERMQRQRERSRANARRAGREPPVARDPIEAYSEQLANFLEDRVRQPPSVPGSDRRPSKPCISVMIAVSDDGRHFKVVVGASGYGRIPDEVRPHLTPDMVRADLPYDARMDAEQRIIEFWHLRDDPQYPGHPLQGYRLLTGAAGFRICYDKCQPAFARNEITPASPVEPPPEGKKPYFPNARTRQDHNAPRSNPGTLASFLAKHGVPPPPTPPSAGDQTSSPTQSPRQQPKKPRRPTQW